jgi:hypothetical protein
MMVMPDALLVTTRLSLRALAERVISPLRVQATGTEIALRVRPGGFGTPKLPDGSWVGVSGTEVVRLGAGGDEQRTGITSSTFWNATAFTGAERPVGADELAAFFGEAARLLAG